MTQPVLATGMARSGGSWMALMLVAGGGAVHLNEPLNRRHPPGLSPGILRVPAPLSYQYIGEHNDAQYGPGFADMFRLRYHVGSELRANRCTLRPGQDGQVPVDLHRRPDPPLAARSWTTPTRVRRPLAGRSALLPRRLPGATPGRHRQQPQADRHALERQPARHRRPAGADQGVSLGLQRRHRPHLEPSRSTWSSTAACSTG